MQFLLGESQHKSACDVSSSAKPSVKFTVPAADCDGLICLGHSGRIEIRKEMRHQVKAGRIVAITVRLITAEGEVQLSTEVAVRPGMAQQVRKDKLGRWALLRMNSRRAGAWFTWHIREQAVVALGNG